MSFPRRVWIGPHPYKMSYDSETLEREGRERGHSLAGLSNHVDQEFSIDPSQAPTGERETVLHEVLHAVFALTELSGDVEEDTISRLSPAMLDVLRRNPRLVAYLTEKV